VTRRRMVRDRKRRNKARRRRMSIGQWNRWRVVYSAEPVGAYRDYPDPPTLPQRLT
jgi:hypothetical protein